jgi:hypothetical protein
MKPVLAFLQNAWFQRPDYVRELFARRDAAFRLDFMRRVLFYKCKTGQNLEKYFGDLLESITFEETTRMIAGDSKSVLPADPVHIRQCLELHRPQIVIAFGNHAHAAVRPLWPGVLLHAQHPASRHPDCQSSLVVVADQLRRFLSDRKII